jgi:hypothetical protein
MRRDAIGESILSYVCLPDRAASTVGDLAEEGASHGALWYWRNVLGAASAHVVADLHAAPWRMLGLAFWGFGATWVLTILSAYAVLISCARTINDMPAWEYWVLAVAVFAAAPFWAGWKLGRRSGGRELPTACCTAALFAATLAFGIYCSELQMRRMLQPWPSMKHPYIEYCVRTLCLFAGAALFRRRAIGIIRTHPANPALQALASTRDRALS